MLCVTLLQVFVSLLLDPNINIRCKAAGALQSLAVHPANQQVPTPPSPPPPPPLRA
jgi:hypothetical protein